MGRRDGPTTISAVTSYRQSRETGTPWTRHRSGRAMNAEVNERRAVRDLGGLLKTDPAASAKIARLKREGKSFIEIRDVLISSKRAAKGPAARR